MDVFQLCKATAVDSRYNHPWRQQTGSCFSLRYPIYPTCFPGRIPTSWDWPAVDYSQFSRWRQQTVSILCTIVSRRLDFSILSDWPRHRIQCGSVKKPGWAIITEVTKIAHISVIFWQISKRSTVLRRAGDLLRIPRWRSRIRFVPAWTVPVCVHKYLVAPQRIAQSGYK